jgi:small subunit ribosomal protein S8
MAVAIARILREEGYVGGVGVVGEGLKKEIEITFRGAKGELALRRVSRPGRRVYCGREELRSTHGTLEVAIVSTSKGLMTDRRAWKEGVGGEVICTVVPPPD